MRVDPSDQYKLAFYMDGCSYHHESQIRAGAGIVWVNRSAEEPNNYWLGNKTSQYAEIAAVLIALQQATKLAKVQLVISSDSNYARHSFISHFPMWKDNSMRTARNKEVKNSELFLACDRSRDDRVLEEGQRPFPNLRSRQERKRRS
ncbi:hypothetical protein F2P81_023410 [Scophthalmus maximus]|uniref:ribonuclease H n=1 Tax=Scophthalmus maximus TaxID=52904 RepID=A0A6A4RXF7_SCOMX|nr:hypothetical protein F2P81_023410 [Scophthalmus maximus]